MTAPVTVTIGGFALPSGYSCQGAADPEDTVTARRALLDGLARDVAAAAVFYASDETDFITGTTLLVDGGMTAGYHQREHSPPAGPGTVPRPSSAPEA